MDRRPDDSLNPFRALSARVTNVTTKVNQQGGVRTRKTHGKHERMVIAEEL
jgi:hypothetical protein